MKKVMRILFISIVIFCSSCDDPNILTEYHSKDKDEALWVEARKKVDRSDWDGAIEIITEQISPGYRAQAKVKETLMHAYGGKCGIRFFELITKLEFNNSASIFENLLPLYSNKSVDLVACEKSYHTLMEIGDRANLRTSNQNIYAALLGVTQISTILKSKLDQDNDGLGDGEMDSGLNARDVSCQAGGGGPELTDEEIRKIAVGMGLTLENFAAIGDELSGGAMGGDLGTIEALCSAPLTLPWVEVSDIPGYSAMNPSQQALLQTQWNQLQGSLSSIECFATKEEQVSEAHIRLMRRILESGDSGFGSCDIATINWSVDLEDPFDPNSDPQLKLTSTCCPSLAVP